MVINLVGSFLGVINLVGSFNEEEECALTEYSLTPAGEYSCSFLNRNTKWKKLPLI